MLAINRFRPGRRRLGNLLEGISGIRHISAGFPSTTGFPTRTPTLERRQTPFHLGIESESPEGGGIDEYQERNTYGTRKEPTPQGVEGGVLDSNIIEVYSPSAASAIIPYTIANIEGDGEEQVDGMQQINIRVSKEKKERWKEATEEYGSLTRLIETAVGNELSRDMQGPGEPETAASGDLVDEVARTVDSLENTVREMDRRLGAVKESVESSGPEYSFRAAVRECTPEKGSAGLTSEEIAARLDARESDVEEAIDALKENEEILPAGRKDVEEAWTSWE